MKLFGIQIGLAKAPSPSPSTGSVSSTKKKRIYSTIKKRPDYRVELLMDKLGSAIDMAKDTTRPNREDLYSIYNQIRKDRHLKAQAETAINDIQQSQYVVLVDGKEDEELRSLFDREWMDDCVEYIADAEFWGHSLIEFPEINELGEFAACFLIPREYVEPVNGNIIMDKTANILLPYTDKLEDLNLVEVEGKEYLGLFEYAAEEVILKKYARTDWSQASERYGMPFLDYATDTEDKAELDKIASMCADFAANGYVIHSKDDTIEIKEAQKSDFYKIYMEAITLANQELSKLINGQTATADTQAFVGTAQVHERILDTFTKARLRRVQNHLNGKLLPLMVKNMYVNADRLAKAKIQYKDLLDKEPVINEPPPATDSGSDASDNSTPDPKKSVQNRSALSKKKRSVGLLPWD
jgi:hypothetical protein